jgi:hypothetical protein
VGPSEPHIPQKQKERARKRKTKRQKDMDKIPPARARTPARPPCGARADTRSAAPGLPRWRRACERACGYGGTRAARAAAPRAPPRRAARCAMCAARTVR